MSSSAFYVKAFNNALINGLTKLIALLCKNVFQIRFFQKTFTLVWKSFREIWAQPPRQNIRVIPKDTFILKRCQCLFDNFTFFCATKQTSPCLVRMKNFLAGSFLPQFEKKFRKEKVLCACALHHRLACFVVWMQSCLELRALVKIQR